MAIKRTFVSNHPAMIAMMILIVVTCPKTATIARAQYWDPNGSHIYNTNSGNVGIGTTNPSNPLEVIGRAKLGGLVFVYRVSPRLQRPMADARHIATAELGGEVEIQR